MNGAAVPGRFPPPRARTELLGTPPAVAALLMVLNPGPELRAMQPWRFPPPRSRLELLGSPSAVAALLLVQRSLAMDGAAVPGRFPPPRVSRGGARSDTYNDRAWVVAVFHIC